MQWKPKGMRWYTFYRLVDSHNLIRGAVLRQMEEQIGMKLEI
jgi:hypothetical protein